METGRLVLAATIVAANVVLGAPMVRDTVKVIRTGFRAGGLRGVMDSLDSEPNMITCGNGPFVYSRNNDSEAAKEDWRKFKQEIASCVKAVREPFSRLFGQSEK